MASGKMFTRMGLVVIAGAVVSACGGEDETDVAVSSDTMATPVAPPVPVMVDTATGAAPTTTPAPMPGTTTPPTAAPGATPPAGKAPATPPAGKAPAQQAGGGNVAEGQQLYGTICVACHGAAGAGGPLAPPLNDNQWLHFTSRPSQAQVATIIKNGVPQNQLKQYPAMMPPMGGGNFSDAQVNSLAAYVLSLSGG